MLEIESLTAGYGGVPVLRDINVKLGAGEKVPAEQLMDATLTTQENVAGFIANHP